MAIDGGRANLSGDPDDIVIEMANAGGANNDDEESKRTADLNNKARLRSKINAGRSAGFGRGASQGSNKADEFNNINHYVIDDDDEDEEES